MIMLNKLIAELLELGDEKRAEQSQRFFKTGEGEYGEGDVFLGISNPKIRELSKKYDLSFEDIQKLLNSKIHEHRLIGLLILIRNKNKEGAFRFYLKNSQKINNWDLVDLSAPKIVGEFILKNPDSKKIIYGLANSNNLWDKRIAIVSTYALIKQGEVEDIFVIAEMLLGDKHDLIHKAVGWMLREAGKQDEKSLEKFLKKHYKVMPRTMLRYVIEKFEEEKRKKFLKGEF